MNATIEQAKAVLVKTAATIKKFSHEIPDEAVRLLAMVDKLTADLEERGRNPVAVVKEVREIKEKLTTARWVAVSGEVRKTDALWAGGKFAQPYLELELAKAALGWMKSDPVALAKIASKQNEASDEPEAKKPVKVDPKVLIKWIETGWAINLQLKTPWGRCKCGQILYPVQTKSGSWKVLKPCDKCYERKNLVQAAAI
jgi:hypothetical protein